MRERLGGRAGFMKNEICDENLEQSKVEIKNKKNMKVLGFIFLLMLNIVIGSQVLTKRTWEPLGIKVPSEYEIEFRNMLASIGQVSICAIFIIFIIGCFTYFKFSKKTIDIKKTKILLWAANCLVLSLMFLCGLNYICYRIF